MKTCFIAFAIFYTALMPSSWAEESAIRWPGGRMAITSDGNAHDPDDIGATPMSMALMHAAGLSDRLVHVDYANHFVHPGHKGAASKAELLEQVTISVNEGARRFDVKADRIFSCQTQLNEATANFVHAARASSEEDPLWFICAGPMTTAYKYLEAVKAVAPEKLLFIRCVSHSPANNRHDPAFKWERLTNAFPTVAQHKLHSQNSAGGEEGLCSSLEHWDWLKHSTNPDLRWLYSRKALSNNR
ncbi:hypothetical protein Pla175_17940 [Pirellulimonas nuda]|uniref:Uncharacterized protein n=1 Tax=Pirellulimonas nuda TaxID=2528009 RepID=A0A518DA97_9BACT|nr:hypothetical protein [Pirellulimonas nuda]QDU88417.1 hypothetical protein Pla175_17940 [Pirellulimonas nuda]